MFADSSGPCFNPQKTQLSFLKLLLLIVFFLFDQPLSFAETVVHSGNTLKFDLTDDDDFICKQDLCGGLDLL